MYSVEKTVSRRPAYSIRIAVSSKKNKNNAISNSLPKIRPPKYPYLADKLVEIIKYFPINQTEISKRTGIPQASISKCLQRKGSLAKASLSPLSTQLPEPIPLWWLTSGPEGGSLKDVLRKEKQQEEEPAPSLEILDKLRDIITAPYQDDPEIIRMNRVLVDLIDIAWTTMQRRPIVSAPDHEKNDIKRQSRQIINVDKKTQKDE